MGVACGDLRRRRPARPGRDQLSTASRPRSITTMGERSVQRPDGRGRAGRADPASSWASASPSSTPTTTAGSTWSQANGHVNDFRPRSPMQMPAQLLLNDGRGQLDRRLDRAGPPWRRAARLGRGLAVGDHRQRRPHRRPHRRRECPAGALAQPDRGVRPFAHALARGNASNRDAVGARVALTAGGETRWRRRFGGGSYLSASDPRLHFGLGRPGGRRVEVTWPSGRREITQTLPRTPATACARETRAESSGRFRSGRPLIARLTLAQVQGNREGSWRGFDRSPADQPVPRPASGEGR